ncbi:VTT domain-containing protein [Saccharopolyspora rosea]|uniref:VTT domain-containing protein n=1 Tax=Saccharopolyspora rosea TaxID=524884 RepID=A0ABW3FRI5_9PSEU|nr:VTT domain-containing protein [Saccharopolyspora rosea]
MIGWLLATAGTAALGSVFPLVNIEIYLIGVLSTVDGLSWWPLALAAAVGQVAGKSLFYLAGKGGFRLGERLTKATEKQRRGRWAAWLETFHRRTEQRPWWGLGALFVSAIPGLPPYSLMCVLSGAAGLPVVGFLTASLAGRGLHFLIVAAAPELVRMLPWFG